MPSAILLVLFLRGVLASVVGAMSAVVSICERSRDATVADIRAWVRAHQEATHAWAVRIGDALIELRAACKREGTLWTSLFPTSREQFEEDDKLPFGRSTAHKLISIARNKALRVSHAKHLPSLPSDWSNLYELSCIPAPKLTRLIEAGEVHAGLGRHEIKRLLNHEKYSKNHPDDAVIPVASAVPPEREEFAHEDDNTQVLLDRVYGLTNLIVGQNRVTAAEAAKAVIAGYLHDADFGGYVMDARMLRDWLSEYVTLLESA
jgi:hypothetical protein